MDTDLVEMKDVDAACAVEIMGWPKLEIGQMEPSLGWWDRYTYIEVRREVRPNDWRGVDWKPSREVADTFQVVRQMQEKGFQFAIMNWGDVWECTVWPPLEGSPAEVCRACAVEQAYTPSLAACRAALIAIKWPKTRKARAEGKSPGRDICVRHGSSREIGLCNACDRFLTPSGLLNHHVREIVFHSMVVRLCDECAAELAKKMKV